MSETMNSRIYRKTQKQMFLLVFGGHFVSLKRTPTWRLIQSFIDLGADTKTQWNTTQVSLFLLILLKEKLD